MSEPYHYREISPENTIFVLIAFEGPDRYSLAGGLGVRVTELSEALAHEGFETHLCFVGAAEAQAHEVQADGRHLWRFCQALSSRYSAGVYEGESEKLREFEASIPAVLLTRIARPAVDQQKLLVVIGEDWHTAPTMEAINDLFYWQGLRHNAIMLWNANSVFGFDGIDWGQLQAASRITTVSRYMKNLMQERGVNPLVLPNGIPERQLRAVPLERVQQFRALTDERLVLAKVARFHPDKNWVASIQAVARLRAMGQQPLFLMRGGIEAYGGEVLDEMDKLNLRRKDVVLDCPTLDECLAAIDQARDDADVLFFRFFLPEEVQRLFYRAADAVLANSTHEPFGLVGLEVMAAQGVAFVGSTGEGYAQHLLNAISLDTNDPNEIVGNLIYLQHRPHLADELRRVGRITARFYVWPCIIEKLISKLQYLLMSGGNRWP